MTRLIASLAVMTLAAAPAMAAPPVASYAVGSDTMQPTLMRGDVVGADAPEGLCGGVTPRPGDVVVYRWPGKPEPRLGRVVAGPGQSVRVRAGRLMIDGQVLATTRRDDQVQVETLANGASYLTLVPRGEAAMIEDTPPLRLGPGDWYIVGDNRNEAADSRLNGPFGEKDICGVATVIIAAKDQARVGAKP